MTVRPRVWVGIDVGKTSHYACAVDESGKVAWSQKVANEQRAIEQVIDRANNTAERVRWVIDLTSPMALMLITVLLGAEQSVAYVPGRVVNTMTGALRGEGKTDAKDARVIAESAPIRSDLSEVSMPDELVVELTQLTGYRADLMADWVRGINRLRALLGSIFPALEAAFDYSTRTPLILVAGLCTPAEIRTAGVDGVTAHLVENQAWPAGITKTAATAVAVASQQQLALPGEAATAALVKRLARKLLDLDREIKDIDKSITERFRDHPYARIIESLPGFGPKPRRGILGGYRRGPGILRHPRPLGLLCRIGACAKGFGPREREPAPAKTLQSPTSAGVLHRRAVQHPRQRAIQAVLRPQARRTTHP